MARRGLNRCSLSSLGPVTLSLRWHTPRAVKPPGRTPYQAKLYSVSAGELWPLIFPLVLKFGLLGEEGAGLKGSPHGTPVQAQRSEGCMLILSRNHHAAAHSDEGHSPLLPTPYL